MNEHQHTPARGTWRQAAGDMAIATCGDCGVRIEQIETSTRTPGAVNVWPWTAVVTR